MPCIQYKDIRFHKKSLATIEKANAICIEYQNQGYSLTLRQLYYQFVARGFIENNMKEYKKLGSTINDARLAGLMDWDFIEDRIRNLAFLPNWPKVKDFLKETPDWFRYDYWETQPVRIEVWVEKDAIAPIIERAAFKYRVPYIACRGYMSQSETWAAGQRFINHNSNNKQPVKVLHFGDHDPSGIDMTRDNDYRLQMFSEGYDVEIIRLALNMDQVKKYNPPSNPAKLTDKRAKGYIKKFGQKSWELDALEPKVIDDLVTEKIKSYINWDAWEKIKSKEERAKKQIKKMATTWKKKI